MHGRRWFFRAVGDNGDAGRDEQQDVNPEQRREVNWHDIIWEDFLPNALSIGVSYETFWHLNPKKLEPFYTAYKRKKEEQDAMVHSWVGNYGISALIVSISRCFSKSSSAKYIKKSLLSKLVSRKKTELSEYEKQKQVDLFFAEQKAQRVNWRKNHKKNNQNE